VVRGVEMGARVAVFRRVAAADMAALQAHAQVHPGVAGLDAPFAALGSRLHVLNVSRSVRAGCMRHFPLLVRWFAAVLPFWICSVATPAGH